MTLPPISADATLNNAPFRKALGEMQRDLLSLLDVSKKLGTIKVTADLSAGKDAQKMTRAIREAVNEMVPTDMQKRIDTMFAGFDVGVNSAARSAAAFQAQAAALRARINELSNAVRLTRAEFQTGMGDATPQEVEALSTRMRQLQTELEKVGAEAKENFGEFSNEALKAGMAARTAVATVEAANGRMPRLGLASQVKLGAGQALQEYGGQLGGLTNGLVGLARGFEQSRVQGVMFEKTLQKNGEEVQKVRSEIEQLAVKYNALPQDMEATYKSLRRSEYGADQARQAIELYAAIATVRGQSVSQAMEALATDVERSSTVMSNAFGISTDQIASQEKYAKTLGVTRDQLTGAQKAQAFLNAVMREEGDAIEQANEALQGYGGAAGQLAKETRDAQKAIGEALLPTVTAGTRILTGFLDVFNAAPEPVKVVTGLLLASGAAIGLLSVPLASVATLYGTLTANTVAAATAETAATAATSRFNAVTTVKNVLLMDTSAALAVANRQAMLYSGSMAASATMTNTLSASVATLGTTLKAVTAAISVYTVAATAALAVGLYWNEQVKGTTKIYEDMDAANQASFERTMKRVQELRQSGTELGRAQAKVLLLQQQLADAQQGDVVGVNVLTGERIYSKPDEARIKQLQADILKARENVTLLYTEAQRRGQLNVKLTDDQTKAVKELNKALEGRRYDLKVEGMTELGADLAKLQKDFNQLREEFKKPFVVKGRLMDPEQTPALREGLAQLDAQLAAEQAQVRKKYADEAVKTARESALEVQRAEIEAMRDGQARRRAERQLEIDQINQEAEEKAKALSDFPKQAAQVEADARRLIAAKRKGWVQEDEQLERESSKRIRDAQTAARDARISSMADGYAKEEAVRRAALDDLRRSIDEQIRLEADPRVRRTLRSEGDAQIAALQRQQERERAESIRAANQQVVDAQVAARDSAIAALEDGRVKEEAVRRAALDDLRRSIAEKVRLLEGDPTRQADVRAAGEQQVAALERQHQSERLQAIREGQQAVQEAMRRGRDAEISAMADGSAKAEAQRQAELADLRADYAERIRLETRPEVRAALRAEAEQAEAAKLREQARERLQEQRQAQEQIASMERQTRDATVAAMRDGVAKEEAVRAAALADLRADLKKQVDELEGSPEQQVQVMAEGNRLITATIAQHAEERRRAYEEAQRVVEGVTRAARDATLSAMQDSYEKEVLVRENALDNLVADLNRQAEEFKGSEAQRAEFVRQANRQVLGLYQQQQRELREIQRAATQQVGDAERSARAAEIAGIRDETAKKRAARSEELRDAQRQAAETLRTFKGTAQQAQAIRDAARREQQAKQAAWNLEDEREARASALRIAQAWQEVSNKQFAAQQAARTAAQAGTELDFSRRIGAVSGVNDDPIERARLEAAAARQRAQFSQQMAEKQLAQDRANLVKTREQALSAENLTAEQRRIIWQDYYADLARLDSDHQAGNTQRLQQREEQERQAAENMRQARIRAAERPVEQSQTRQGELERSRALVTSDAELLAINTRISQERQTQIGALQAQLDGVEGVVLSAEERAKIEARIRSLQHDQAVSLKEQQQLQRDVAASTLSRADAEAQLAEKLARTEADRVAAQQKQLAVAQLRKAELDRQILAEGREKERNALIEQRFSVLGQIADLQDRINGAPLEAEQRRLELYKAQAAAQLALQGLGGDEVAQAQLTVQIAAQELLLANQRVAAAQTELELQQALSGQAAARVALTQALQQQRVAAATAQAEALSKSAESASSEAAAIREVLAAEDKRRQRAAEARAYELELLDIAQARAQAEARITGAAEDSVRSAELELQATRDRLDLLSQQSSQVERDPRAAADLLKEQIDLLARQAEAERRLAEARRQKRDLTEQLTESERRLMALLDPKSLDWEGRATLRLTEAREGLVRAERNYLAVREQYRKTGSTADAEKLRSATDALTGSIQAQREAVRQLADAYVGMQDAAARIRAATGGEDAFDANVERRRLDAINSRRVAAQKALREALAGGEAAQIQEAADALAQQEERWKKQADLMKSKGFQVSDVASSESRRLARVLDELGIQRESEVGTLQQRAAIAEKEVLASLRMHDAVTVFDKSTQELLDGLSQRAEQQRSAVQGARQDVLSRQASEDLAEALDKLAQQLQKQAAGITKAATKPTPQTNDSLNQLAATLAKPVQDAVAAIRPPAPPAAAPASPQWLLYYVKSLSTPQVIQQTVAQVTEETLSRLPRLVGAYAPLDRPATTPASHTVVYQFEVGDTYITASNPADAKRQLDGWWEGKLRELDRRKGWEPKRC